MNTKTIDVSAYIGAWPYTGHGIREAKDLVAEMDRYEISTVALASTAPLFSAVTTGNNMVMDACQLYPQRLHPLLVTFPLEPGLTRESLARWREEGCVGIRLWPQSHGYKLAHPSAQKMLSLIADIGLPIFLAVRATSNWVLPQLSLDDVSAGIAAHKKLKVVVGGFNYSEFPRAVDLAKEHEGVYLEFSGLQMRDPLESLLQYVDASRILLGTALPLQYPRCNLVKVEQAQVGENVKNAVRMENARRLLGLTD